MTWFIKTAVLLSLIIFCNKAFAQIDTMKYLKQFEANKMEYSGEKFSKLYKKLKIKPVNFSHVTSTYTSSTTFFYPGKIEVRIEWINSPYSEENQILKAMNCYNTSKCSFTKEIKNTFDKFKIKNIIVVSPDEYIVPGCIGQLKPVKDIRKFFNDRISGTPPIKDISFGDLLIRVRPLLPISVQNTRHSKNKKRTSTSYIKFAFNEKYISKETLEVAIEWNNPIKYEEIKKIKNKTDTAFTEKQYNLYWEKTIKNIRLSNS